MRFSFRLLSISLVCVALLCGCTKTIEDTGDGSKFVGVWNGSIEFEGGKSELYTLVIGGGGTQITVSDSVGIYDTFGIYDPPYHHDCRAQININANVTGYTFTAPVQRLVDYCQDSTYISSTGSLNGGTLTIVSMRWFRNDTTTRTFIGTKQ